MFGILKIKVNKFITLKLLEPKDSKAAFSLIERNREMFSRWLNWVNFIQTEEQEKQYLKSLSQNIKKSYELAFGIYFEKELIGTMGFINIDRLNKNALLGYCLDKDYQHKGIMTDCCKSIIDFAFTELNLHRIELKIAPENFRSKALARRLNFKSEGILAECYILNGIFIDCEIFSLLNKNRGNSQVSVA